MGADYAHIDAKLLLRTPRAELDELFQHSSSGKVPAGACTGTFLLASGRAAAAPAAGLIRLFLWKGKVFDPGSGTLCNRIGPAGRCAVRAAVYLGTSWFDAGPAIILDYSATSGIARHVRDEIRQVAPGIFLGIAYWHRHRILRFVLDFSDQHAAGRNRAVTSK